MGKTSPAGKLRPAGAESRPVRRINLNRKGLCAILTIGRGRDLAIRMQPGTRRTITWTKRKRAVKRASAKMRVNDGKCVINPIAGESRGEDGAGK